MRQKLKEIAERTIKDLHALGIPIRENKQFLSLKLQDEGDDRIVFCVARDLVCEENCHDLLGVDLS